MFWIIFAIIWSLPGAYWSSNRAVRSQGKSEHLSAAESQMTNILELVMTLSWPLGYGFIFLSGYGFLKEIGILALIHFMVVPILEGTISGFMAIKREGRAERSHYMRVGVVFGIFILTAIWLMSR